MPKATISLLWVSIFVYIYSIFIFFSMFFVLSLSLDLLIIYSTFVVYLLKHVTSIPINSVNISNNVSDLLLLVHVRFVLLFSFFFFEKKRNTHFINRTVEQLQIAYIQIVTFTRSVLFVCNFWYWTSISFCSRLFSLFLSHTLNEQLFTFFFRTVF